MRTPKVPEVCAHISADTCTSHSHACVHTRVHAYAQLTALRLHSINGLQNINEVESSLYELAPLQQLRHFLFRKTRPLATPLSFPDSTFKTWVPGHCHSSTLLLTEAPPLSVRCGCNNSACA